jgi:tetratricopeptide (TPR) repeat protein
MQESLALSQRALDLDPLDLLINYHMGWFCFYAREYRQCVEHCRKVRAMDGSFGRARQMAGEAYEQMGLHDEAIAEFRVAVELSSGDLESVAMLGRALAVRGRHEEARTILDRLQNESRYVSPYSIALIYLAFGECDRALGALQKAFADRSTHMTYANVDPRLDELRGHPVMQTLMREMRLSP